MQGNIGSRRLTKALLIGSSALMAGLTMAASGAAYAQDDSSSAQTGGTVSEVVVTGSRIAKKDFTSNSPIVTVSSAQFENTASVAIQSTLNKLPQFTPDEAQLGFQTGEVQPTAISTPGIATASLRGLGSNRNLVLVDGRRLTPVNGLNVIDLNTIPSSMIDHVESITGGASAVYGADAMSGVVNFILKKNFQGLDVDASYSLSQRGDDREFKVSALFGTNFADDKGNITFGLEHYTRSPVRQQERDFYVKGEQDPTVASNALFTFAGARYAPSAATGGCPSAAAYISQFGVAPAGQSLPAFLGDQDGLCVFGGGVAGDVQFNADGSLFSTGWFLGPYGAWASSLYKGTVDGTVVAPLNQLNPFTNAPVQNLKLNTTVPWLSSPMHRWTMYSNAHFDLNDNLSVFAVGNFATTETNTLLLPTTPINGWGALVPYNSTTDSPVLADGVTPNPSFIATGQAGAGHPVPTSLAILLNSRLGASFPSPAFPGLGSPNPFANSPEFGPNAGTSAANTPWALNLIPDPNTTWLPPRTTDVRDTNWQVTAGLDFKVPNTDWSGELYGSHGETLDYQIGGGNVDLDRWRAIITAPDYGKGFNFTGNQYPLIGGGFGAGMGSCASGLHDALLFNTRPSQDCIDALTVTLQSTNIVTQDVVEFDAQGTLFSLPAGDVKASVGADYRGNRLVFRPDSLQDINNFADQVSGLYPTQGFDASVAAKEGYGELSIPLIANQPFFKLLELNPGARYSTYSNSQSGWTYKLLGDWQVNDWMRFRGGYNLAVRAPTVAESYLALQEVYGGSSGWGDPCSPTTNAPYGASAAANSNGANGANSALAICKQQMGGPASQGAIAYYNGQTGQPNTFNLGALWVDQIGNSNLKPETAHTWTAGVVLTSPVSNPWLDRAQLSVDWYKITIGGVIGFESSDVINEACYGQNVLDGGGNVDPTLLAAALATQACHRSLRSTATGAYEITEVAYQNLGKIETSGFDVQANWGVTFDDVGMNSIPGSMNVNVLFNYLSHMTTNTGQPNAWNIDWAGTMGPSFAGVNSGAFRWKVNSTFTYMVGPASLSLNWQHLPSVKPVTYYNASATTVSNPNGPASPTNTSTGIGSYNRFDLSATYKIKGTNYSLRGGVDNLLDASPVITGATLTTAPAGVAPYVPTTGMGTTNPLFYDVIGRKFFVAINARF